MGVDQVFVKRRGLVKVGIVKDRVGELLMTVLFCPARKTPCP